MIQISFCFDYVYGAMEEGGLGVMNHIFFDITWTAGVHVCVIYLGKRLAPGMHYRKKARQQRQCDAQEMFYWDTSGTGIQCGCYFDTRHLPKHCCRPSTPLHGNSIP